MKKYYFFFFFSLLYVIAPYQINIFIDSLIDPARSITNGSFEYPYSNISFVMNKIPLILQSQENNNISIGIFLKYNPEIEYSHYYLDEYFDLNLVNSSSLHFCSYYWKDLNPPKNCNSSEKSILDIKSNSLNNYTTDFLLFMYQGLIIFENLVITLNFQHPEIRVMIEIYTCNIVFIDCILRLNVLILGYDLNNRNLNFLSIINSNLTAENSIFFEFIKNELTNSLKNFESDFIIFYAKYIENQIYIDSSSDYLIKLINCVIKTSFRIYKIKDISLFEVDGNDRVLIHLENNLFIHENSILLTDCKTNIDHYSFSLTLTYARTVFLINNKVEFNSIFDDCTIRSIRFDFEGSDKLIFQNEFYKNVLLYFILDGIQEIILDNIDIFTNISVIERDNFIIDENYILIYAHDYYSLNITNLNIFNYGFNNMILMHFQPYLHGYFLFMNNITLYKVYGKIYILFEPNNFLENKEEIHKMIEIHSIYFNEIIEGGFTFSGLVPTFLHLIKFKNCEFKKFYNGNIMNNVKSSPLKLVPIIFFEQILFKTLIFENIKFNNINDYKGVFIFIILNMFNNTIFINNFEVNYCNSTGINSFLLIETSKKVISKIKLFNIFFYNIICYGNLISIKPSDDKLVIVDNVYSDIKIKTFKIYNFTQKRQSEKIIDSWNLLNPNLLYIVFPYLHLEDFIIKNSNFIIKHHFFLLSSIYSIIMKNFDLNQLVFIYENSENDENLENHFIHVFPANKYILKINLENLNIENLNNQVLDKIIKKNIIIPLTLNVFFSLIAIDEKNIILKISNSTFNLIDGGRLNFVILAFTYESYFSKFIKKTNISEIIIHDSNFNHIISNEGTVLNCYEGKVILSNNLFFANEGKVKGGVFYLSNRCNLTIENSTFINNKASLGQILAYYSSTLKEKNGRLLRMRNNSFYQLESNFSNEIGLFYFENNHNFIYDCSFFSEEMENDYNINWKCNKNLNKGNKNLLTTNYNIKFNKYIDLMNESALPLIYKNYSLYKPLAEIYISYPKYKNISKISYSFHLELVSESFQISLSQIDNSSTYSNFYHFSIINPLKQKTRYSLFGYYNDQIGFIRCSLTDPYSDCYFPFIILNMNECKLGQIYNSLTCITCVESYILPFNSDSGKCKACLIYANCDEGIIKPKTGFWRSNKLSDQIYFCNTVNNRCIGGINSDCDNGYTGVLCQGCDINLGFYKGHQGYCNKCQNSSAVNFLFFIMEFFIFFAFEIYIVYSDSSCLSNHNVHDFEGIKKKYSQKDQISKLINIMITYLQIITLLEFYSVNLPNELFSFAEFFVNPNNDIFYSHYCFLSENGWDKNIPLVYLNFILIIATSFIRLIFLFIFWALITYKKKSEDSIVKSKNSIKDNESSLINNNSMVPLNQDFESLYFLNEKNSEKLKMNYYFLAFLSWFSIESIMILKQIFQMFCISINGDNYILSDLNYKCIDNYYSIYLPFVIYPSLFIFSFVFPVIIYGSLIINKNNLKKKNVLNKLATLYLAVKPEYFYWHFVNYLFKFSIVIVGALFGSIDPIKIVAVLIILLIYISLIFFIQPYVFHLLNRLEIVCCFIFLITLTFSQTQIITNLYSSLTYLNYENPNFGWIQTLGYYLILILNFSFVLFLVFKIIILFSRRIRQFVTKGNICLRFLNKFRKEKEIEKDRDSNEYDNYRETNLDTNINQQIQNEIVIEKNNEKKE